MQKISGDIPIIYIALELCDVTLKNLIEDKNSVSVTSDPIEILRQTTTGLSFLHIKELITGT